ncbi:MAG: ABC transporter ATP-binding protein [Planctomycetes bacterium]|nr:ABC transporter ATP-binding protein [Planctomycetota bacterium]
MIELHQINRVFRNGESTVHALRDVDLRIEAAEYMSILGPSGSGKSTLMHILGCLDTATGGRYILNNHDISTLDVNQMAAIRNRNIGFIFQRFHLLPRSTALQNVAMPMRLAGMKNADRMLRAAQLLQRVGLGDRMHHRPSQLSGGQQQRVAIARALANAPQLLLADEPTGNLDTQSGSQIVQLLEELQAEGTTVVIVTHDEELAARTGRVVRMLDGKIASDAVKA